MKHFFLWLVAGLLSVTALAETVTNEVFRLDFEQSEGYQLGDVFAQSNGWFYTTANSNTLAKVVDSETFPIVSGSQALLVGVKETGYDRSAPTYDFDLSSIDTKNNYVLFEFQVKPSEVGSGSYAADLLITDTNNVSLVRALVFNGGFWSQSYSLKTSANAWAFNPDTYQGGPEKIDGRANFSEFNTVSWLWDLGKQTLISAKYNEEECYYTNRWDESGVEYTVNANIPYGINPTFSGLPSRIRLIGRFERPEWGFDAFVIKTISKEGSANPGKLACSARSIALNYSSTNTAFTITNDGDEPFSYTVESNSEWLIPVAVSGVCENVSTIRFDVDRSLLPEAQYGRAIVTVDAGDAGSCQVSVSAQNGRAYYYSDFKSPFYEYGAILALQDRWNNNMQPPTTYSIVVTNAYEREGVAFINKTSWYDGQTLAINTRKDQIIHLGMDLYVPGDTESQSLELRAGYWSKAWSLNLRCDTASGACYVTDVNGNTLALDGWEFPLDTWTRFDVTLDYQAQLLTGITLGDNTTNLALELMHDTNDAEIHNFADFAVYAVPQDNQSNIAFTDLIIEEQERTGDPELVAPAFVQFGDADSGEIIVRNAGVGSFDCTITALENTTLFSFDPDTVTVSDKGTFKANINREGVEPGYYLTHLLIDAGTVGAATTIASVAVGGYYYSTGFETPWYQDGSLAGQQTWTFDPDQPKENFDASISNGVLYLGHAPGYTGCRADVVVSTNYQITVKTSILASSEGDDGGRLYFKQNSAFPYIEFMVTKDIINKQLKLSVNGVPEEEFVAFADDCLDQWIDFSYTLWFADQSVSKVVFGETVIENPSLELNNFNNKFSKYIVCASDGANFAIDDIRIFNSEIVPEPALLGLAALALAFFLKRR